MYTDTCYVCKSLYPKIRSIAAENDDVLWAKLNGSEPEMVELFNALGVTKVPLFHMVLDGQLVAELSASLSPEKLATFRQQLATHKHAARALAAKRQQDSAAAAGDVAEQQQQQQEQQREAIAA